MKQVKHIFVYVVDRPEDPFWGVKQLVKRACPDTHEVTEVRLSDRHYELIHATEYSSSKNFRFLKYRGVFKALEAALEQAVGECTDAKPGILYFSDEGVWAAFLKQFLSRYSGRRFVTVNVQHGFEHRVRPNSSLVRRLTNRVVTLMTGYPGLGLGCFGGVGPGVFDLYLTYDAETSAFINAGTGDRTISCPNVIKAELLSEVRRIRNGNRLETSAGVVLFAMQPRIRGIRGRPQINCDTLQTLQELTPLAQLLSEKYGQRLVVRFHPGMNQKKAHEVFMASGISPFAIVDPNLRFSESLARTRMVLSYDSTALWDAFLVGIVPVTVNCRCFEGRLQFPHETLTLGPDMETRLGILMSDSTAERYRSREFGADLDMAVLLDLLVKRIDEKSGEGSRPIVD